MAQLSRPYQIALVVLGLFAAVWFVALRGHSASTSSTPAAGAPVSAPASTAGSSAGANAKAAAAPTPIYHGSAPGVEGLTRAIAKAHEAVATSHQNAKQLEEKSAQASSTSAAASGSPASTTSPRPGTARIHRSSVAHAPKNPAARSTKADTTRVAGKLKSTEARTGPQRTPARQLLVERALREGKIAVILFWSPKGADDLAVQAELRLLEAIHHFIRPVAHVPAVRRALERSGLELQKKFATFEARANQVTSFGSFTHAVQVYETPTILIVNKHGQTTTLTGLTDAYSIEQAIDEARHA